MNLTTLSLYEQAILVLSALILYTSFSLLAHTKLLGLINIFAGQGTLLAITTALVAFVSEQPHLYISAILTLILKAILIPSMLRHQVFKFNLHQSKETLDNFTLISLSGVAIVIFSYYVVLPIEYLATEATRNVIAISLANVLLSMLLIISRRQVVTQVVGFMAIENGLFFAAVASTQGMPMVVELGIAFDVLVAAVLFGIFFFHISKNLDMSNVDRMNLLREKDD